MRIALVTENFLPKVDGVTRTLAMLLTHLQRRGDQTIVLGPQGAPRRYAGAGVFRAPGIPLPFYPELRFLLPPPGFEHLLARFRPDVIHVVDPVILGAAGIFWARRLGIPLISSYHTNLADYCDYFRVPALAQPLWAYRRALHNQCAMTLCPSPSTAAQLGLRGFERLGIWSRGVDSQLFNPSQRSTAWRVRVAGDSARAIILYVGRLSYEKNLSALARAFDQVDGERAHLVLVGDGPARAELEAALGPRRATFTGYLHGRALAEAYASADVFAFPSMTETFGQAVNEAMASGLPVVAFDADGVRDLVRHGETGYLIPPRDINAFARAIQRLVDVPDERASLSVRAQATASARTWESVLDGLLDSYRAIIGRSSLARAA